MGVSECRVPSHCELLQPTTSVWLIATTTVSLTERSSKPLPWAAEWRRNQWLPWAGPTCQAMLPPHLALGMHLRVRFPLQDLDLSERPLMVLASMATVESGL